MTEAIIAAAVLIVAAVSGIFLKPTPDQTRPIYPDDLTGHAKTGSSDHHSHH
jgi:hypothetical protein